MVEPFPGWSDWSSNRHDCCHAGMVFFPIRLYLGKGLLQRNRPPTVGFFIDIMRVGGIGLINNVTVAFSVIVVTAILGHLEQRR